jgi:hypothetical protein
MNPAYSVSVDEHTALDVAPLHPSVARLLQRLAALPEVEARKWRPIVATFQECWNDIAAMKRILRPDSSARNAELTTVADPSPGVVNDGLHPAGLHSQAR